jgi:hypothetical protein
MSARRRELTEVTHISAQGIWLLARDKELFLPYAQFPWFKNANVAKSRGAGISIGPTSMSISRRRSSSIPSAFP